MSVYKTDINLLERAVNSILMQTYQNLEFIIIDDGASEESLIYLDNIADNRVCIIHNERNMGLATSLNKGINLAKGKYIARMDADDYSLPDRIFEQVSYLEEHNEIDVLACISMDIRNGKFLGGIGGAYLNLDSEDLKIELSLAPKTFPHPTVVFRTSFLLENNIRYDESFLRAQDYDMWARCSMYGKLDSLQKVLFYYDKSEDGKKAISDLQAMYSDQTKLKCLQRLLPQASDKDKQLYVNMRNTSIFGTVSDNITLVRNLIHANSEFEIYDKKKFASILYFWWGRKMIYPENLAFLPSFLLHPIFMMNVIMAYIIRFPKHLAENRYVKHMANSEINKGIALRG